MSREWTKEELNTASEIMKQNGEMGFEEFCHALEQKQPVSFELAERSRKELVKDISEILGEKAEYMRMPTCAYRVGGYTIAKDGTLTWEADDDAEVLLRALTARGWDYAIVIDTAVTEETQPEVKAEPDASAEENTCGEAEADTYGFCIELPDEALPDAARVNLDRLIESKGNLLRKALGTDTIVYKITDGKIRFLWFHISGSPEEVTAYTQLITALPMEITDVREIEKKDYSVNKIDLSGLKILMAEDNDLNAEIAIVQLEELGIKITRAADGEEAVRIFKENPQGRFGLILMDVMMPKMNGYEATRAIRHLDDCPDGRKIPIIAMTANAFAEDVQASLDAGMNGHISKPIVMDEVIKTITRNLN